MPRSYEIVAQLAGMRKPQEFVVCPLSAGGDPTMLTVQSDRAIGRFDRTTGAGVLNWRGSGHKGFAHLSRVLGAEPYQFPPAFVAEAIAKEPKKGDVLHGVLIIG